MMFPNNKYDVIIADPPWVYRNKRTGGSMSSGSESKYPCITVDVLKEFPIQDIADTDCVMFLWITTPLKEEILRSGLIETWGFKYKTTIYWKKLHKLGMGYWFRGQMEECLVCVKGNIKAFRCQKPNIIESVPRKHSQKPEEFFQLIEPSLERFNLNRKIELFARSRRNGWDTWGDQIE